MVMSTEVNARDLHIDTGKALDLVETRLRKTPKSLMACLEGRAPVLYIRFQNIADSINEAVLDNNQFSADQVMRSIMVARELMVDNGVSQLYCYTDEQVLDLLNTLYD